jgi:hypothetical protein
VRIAVDVDQGTVSAGDLLVRHPVATVWRAATQNDGVRIGPMAELSQGVRRRWVRWGLDRLETELVSAIPRDEGANPSWPAVSCPRRYDAPIIRIANRTRL